MSEIAVSLLLLLIFSIGFILGILIPTDFSKKRKKANKVKRAENLGISFETNEEYQNFLSYDGSPQQ